MKQRDWLIAAVAFVGVIAYVFVASRAGGVGFPLDDSWIHQVYGRNLAQTGQWAFVPGVPSAGSTSPLYTLLLAVGYVLHVPYLLWAYGWGALALAFAGIVAARLAETLYPKVPNVGIAAGLMIVTAWHLVWAAASGMETILFGALSLLLMGLAWRELSAVEGIRPAFGRGLLFGVVGALLTLARPEGIGLVGLCGLLMIVARPQRSGGMLAVWVVGAMLGWLIFVSPNLFQNYQLNGTPLPNTSAAKQAENVPLLALPLWQRVINMVYPLSAGGQLILIPGAIYALYDLIGRTRRDRRMLLFWAVPLWIVAVVLLYAWRLPAPYQHGRYVMTALPAFIVLGGSGTLALIANASRHLASRVLTRVLLVTTVIVFPLFWLSGASIYGRDVALIEGEMVTAAKWIAENIPTSSTSTPMAVHDIGAVGYFAPRPLFDLAGLVTQEVVPIILDPPALMRLMQARGVRYMMVSPPQLPTTADDRRLCRLYSTPGQDSPIHMTVYQIAWDGNCPNGNNSTP